MTDQIDDWHKLASYDTNIQGELHANLLKNNGIKVSIQALSAIPGMNSGAILWVPQNDLDKARQILEGIDVDHTDIDETHVDDTDINGTDINDTDINGTDIDNNDDALNR